MYNITESKNSISSYGICNNSLAYKDNSTVFEKKLFLNNTVINKKATTGFQLTKHYLIFSNWDNETYKLSIEDNKLLKLPFDQVSVVKVGEHVMYSKNEEFFINLDDEEYYSIPSNLVKGLFYSND